MTRRDEPQAFPFATPSTGISHMECGMTLRDYFAGQALVGIATNQVDENLTIKGNAIVAANWAYLYADAMLAERDK